MKNVRPISFAKCDTKKGLMPSWWGRTRNTWCLKHAAQRAINEQRVVDWADAGRKLPYSHSEARAKVHLVARLNQPAGLAQLAVDRHSRAIFGMENVLPRRPWYRR